MASSLSELKAPKAARPVAERHASSVSHSARGLVLALGLAAVLWALVFLALQAVAGLVFAA
jgi:hypothetical protein